MYSAVQRKSNIQEFAVLLHRQPGLFHSAAFSYI